jgi:hypothetical protein
MRQAVKGKWEADSKGQVRFQKMLVLDVKSETSGLGRTRNGNSESMAQMPIARGRTIGCLSIPSAIGLRTDKTDGQGFALLLRSEIWSYITDPTTSCSPARATFSLVVVTGRGKYMVKQKDKKGNEREERDPARPRLK